MLVDVCCSRCGKSCTLDIEDKSKKEVQAWLDKDTNGYQCFGHHVEFGPRSQFWTVDWDTLREGECPSEEGYIKKLKDMYEEVYTVEELKEKYKITGFFYGECAVTSIDDNSDNCFGYSESPKGKRYYFRGRKNAI